MLLPDELLSRQFTGVTLHDQRHFYASGLRRGHLLTVQRALGHAKATTTLNTYAYLWPTAQDRTRRAAGDLLAPKCSRFLQNVCGLKGGHRPVNCKFSADYTLKRNVARVVSRDSLTCTDGRRRLSDLRLCLSRQQPRLTGRHPLWPICHGPQTAQKITKPSPT